MIRYAVRGLIIQDKKILYLTGHAEDFWWLPGGGVEEGESNEEALRRELKEELGVEVASFQEYAEFSIPSRSNPANSVHNTAYTVQISGPVVLQGEITKMTWASKEDLQTLPLYHGAYESIIPRLIADNLL